MEEFFQIHAGRFAIARLGAGEVPLQSYGTNDRQLDFFPRLRYAPPWAISEPSLREQVPFFRLYALDLVAL